MAKRNNDAPIEAPCRYDPATILDAIARLGEQIQDVRNGLATVDQKVTQLRALDQQNLLQAIKQLRGSLDLATSENKRQLEFMGSQIRGTTLRIQSLDLALSNRKLEELTAKVTARPAGSEAMVGESGDGL